MISLRRKVGWFSDPVLVIVSNPADHIPNSPFLLYTAVPGIYPSFQAYLGS